MERALSHIHIEAGPAGWVKAFWRREHGHESTAYLRFTYVRRARRWRATELHLFDSTQVALRDIPLFKIEQALNASAAVLLDLARDVDADPPADLPAAFKKHYRAAPRKPLRRPAGRALDDAFYREVAWAYRYAVARGLPPGKTLAKESGVPQGTVNRWIAEARKPERGYLPPGEPGKVSA